MNFIIIMLKINMVTTQDYYSLTPTVWCVKLKLEILMKILIRRKKMLDFSNYSIKSKFYNHPNKLVAFKIKVETAGVAIKKFVWLKPKNY